MTRPRVVIGLGVLFGVIGAAGQIWLLQLGAFASAPLRTTLSVVIAILIGVLAGRTAKPSAVRVAALMGVVAGAILSLVGLGALLMDPALIGLDPLSSVESFLVFTSSIMAGTVLASWIISGVAALVAWPLSLEAVTEDEG